jgi:ATP-dependent DNA ligase
MRMPVSLDARILSVRSPIRLSDFVPRGQPRHCERSGLGFEEGELRRVVKEKFGKKSAFPGFIKPALAEQLSRPPKGEGWIHEVKFDGYRVQVHIANDAVKVLTRRGIDWTTRI